jgi:hypothetical protein
MDQVSQAHGRDRAGNGQHGDDDEGESHAFNR